MAILTINSNLAASLASLNIGTATQNVQNDTQALASGNRIVSAATDVTALSIGTSLQGQVSSLTTALTISSQATSLLQVADGALTQIQSILQQMQTIATSAQAGDLSNTQRGFLQQQFSDLSTQIDQLSSSTNFNGVNLLNGSIAGGSTINTNSNAGNANLPIESGNVVTVSGALAAGDNITVNGVTFNLDVSGGASLQGASVNDTAANIADALNNSGAAALTDYRFAASGANVVAYYIGGAPAAGSPIPTITASKGQGTNLTVASPAFTTGGTAVGTIVTNAADSFVVNGVTIASGTYGGGASISAETTNLVNYLNATSNNAWAGITFYATGSSGVIYASYNGAASPALTLSDSTTAGDISGNVTNATLNTLGTTGLSAGSTVAVGTVQGQGLFVTNTVNSASDFGQAVDLSSVDSNAAFLGSFGGTGTIGAITGTYNGGGTPTVTFSVVVGNDTYTSNAVNVSSLTGAAPTTITFVGKNTVSGAGEGGSFTLSLQGGQANITSQLGVNSLVSAMNADLSGVQAYQNRNVLSYNNNYTAQVGSTITGVLTGSSLTWNSNSFSTPLVSSVSVSAPSTGTTDAKISVVVNGQTYSTQAGIGDTLKTDTAYELVNQSNPSQVITLSTGNISNANASGTGGTAVDLTTASNAAAFQTALSNALGISSSKAALSFQVGSSSSDSIGVSLQSAATSTLFNGASLDVSTASDAATAYTAVTSALDTIGGYRASVGALEQSFQFASAAAQSSQQNEQAAASSLLNTDVATASTDFATQQVKLQAGIAVLAQANQLQQAVLKLIG